uniref:Uncharacterized protein n=1 Tax=Anguilla anguilla TaxID=7936 RepID=A0A0E9TZH5_ANGAN
MQFPGSYLAVKIFRNTTSWIIKTWGVVPQQEKSKVSELSVLFMNLSVITVG